VTAWHLCWLANIGFFSGQTRADFNQDLRIQVAFTKTECGLKKHPLLKNSVVDRFWHDPLSEKTVCPAQQRVSDMTGKYLF
jgi:hypothetical protein